MDYGEIMLDTRYIHLHEALGLGVMWLHQNAKILGKQPAFSAPTRAPETAKQPAPRDTAQPTTSRKSNEPPSFDALDRLRRQTQAKEKAEAEKQVVKTAAAPIPFAVPMPTRAVRVMALSVCASMPDIVHKRLFSEQDGELLHKMFAAINLQPSDVHCTTWLKNFDNFNPKPDLSQVQADAPQVQAEWQQCGQPPLLLLGEFFERDDVQQCLRETLPRAYYFIIPHPLRILKHPELKRDAWNGLQKLQKRLNANPRAAI